MSAGYRRDHRGGNGETDQRGLRPGDPGLSDADLSADPGGTQHGTCELLRFCHLKAGYLLSCSLRHLQRPGASRIQEDRNLELPRRKLPDHPGLKQGGKK